MSQHELSSLVHADGGRVHFVPRSSPGHFGGEVFPHGRQRSQQQHEGGLQTSSGGGGGRGQTSPEGKYVFSPYQDTQTQELGEDLSWMKASSGVQLPLMDRPPDRLRPPQGQSQLSPISEEEQLRGSMKAGKVSWMFSPR